MSLIGCSTKPISVDIQGVMHARFLFAFAPALLLAACIPQGREVDPAPSVEDLPPTAAEIGITQVDSRFFRRFELADAQAALSSFAESCSYATRREDKSGLTQIADWQLSCQAAENWPRARAIDFFSEHFEPVKVGDGAAFATGYFEPEIQGSLTRSSVNNVPIYAVPDDLVREWPASTPQSEREGRAPLGRVNASGNHVPYFDRAQIEDGALAGRGLEIAYAADPVEFFFLQIQGSGLIRKPDGSLMRIGYASQNGRGYTGIGRVMRERGLLGDGEGQYAGSMQGIMQYIRKNPADGRALMRLNKSWIFFRVLETDGPLGSLGVPVRGESSVAVDPNYVPYGAPVLLDLDREEANGLWIAQDTGGAIKGDNRFDTFWGNGPRARAVAGGMSARGQAIILLPKASAERLLK